MDKITTTDVKVNTETRPEPKVFTSDVVNCEDVTKGFTTNDVNNQGTTNDGQDIFTSNTVKSRVYNVQNLKKYGKDIKPLTHEEAKNRGRQGGIKSGEVRKARKTMRETMLEMLSMELSKEKLEEMGIDTSVLNNDFTYQAAIISAMLREASNGDTKAMQLLRDTIGEMPVQRQEISQEIVTKDDTALMDNLKNALIS